jgi:hypothetical protein
VPYTIAMAALPQSLVVAVMLYAAGTGVAAAQQGDRRPVAVIELADSPQGSELARGLGNVLNQHRDLRPVDDVTMWSELIGPIDDEEQLRYDRALDEKSAVTAALARGDYAQAGRIAESGQGLLHFVRPAHRVLALYAELAFLRGYALLGERKADPAVLAFRLARQLNPRFAPDAARTLPEIVQAFEIATRAAVPTGTISVGGTSGRVVIDGTDVGNAPAWFTTSAGLHVVWVVGVDRDPRGKLVEVAPRRKTEVRIDDAPSSKATRVRRARVALQAAPDPTARAAAIRHLAELLDVHDAVLLTTAGGKIIVQTWRDRAPGFSALREWKPGGVAADLLVPLAPPAPAPVEKQVEIVLPPPPERDWYERPLYWGVGGGVVVAVLASVIAYRSWDRTLQSSSEVRFAR